MADIGADIKEEVRTLSMRRIFRAIIKIKMLTFKAYFLKKTGKPELITEDNCKDPHEEVLLEFAS